MEPLSCKNCCHNPLQISGIGTSFGYCIRHRAALPASHLTTCGQLLRKDVLRARAQSERQIHQGRYSSTEVRLLADPTAEAATEGLVEKLNGLSETDPVVEEIANYGALDSKIASIAALRSSRSARAQVAMLSLGRGYVRNCADRGGPWTAGLHILWWTLRRLDDEPSLEASDLLGPITTSITEFAQVAKWRLMALRIAMICDIADQAAEEGDDLAALALTARQAIIETDAGDPHSLLTWLHTHITEFSNALPQARYDELRDQLHRSKDNL
ncbi:MAG: hypothetical protein IPK80_27965 [Nannocystis sp.]|nr:hypothetical protein [Nannocystis sp.]